MFRFLALTSATEAFDLRVKATTLEAAFQEFADFWWNDELGHYAVFHYTDLVARVVPRATPDGSKNEPVLEMWPAEITEGNRFACGD